MDARAAIFEHAERIGIRCSGAWNFDGVSPNSGMTLIKPLDRHPHITALAGEKVRSAAHELTGDIPVRSGHPGLLFTLPNATAWTLPHKHWHVDFPRLPVDGVPGVQIFALLDVVAPQGGGTLAVTGSHRLLNTGSRMNSADLRKTLNKETYFRELMSNHNNERGERSHFLFQVGRVGDVELQVVEMTGDPGDVYFMDMRVLHTIAPNCRPTPRIMLTDRFLPASSHAALVAR